MEQYRRLLKARAALLLEQPFFGSLCLRLETVEDNTCGGAWTDGVKFAYNPHYLSTLKDNELKGLLAHTVMHAACQHHKRRNGRDERIWNMACDHSINWILLRAGFELPPGYLDDEKYHRMTAEDIFLEMSREFDQDGNPETGKQQDGPKRLDAEYEDGQGQGDNLESNEEKDRDQASGEGENSESSQTEDAKKTEEADKEEHPDKSADPGGTGEVRDAPENDTGGGDSGDEKDIDWLTAMAQAANQARDCGDIPGDLLRMVEEMLYPKVDWQELLDRFINARARNDYSWTPPSRRHLHMNIYLPSLSTQQLPEVVLAIDTSGSISPGELDQFSAELSGILESYDTEVRVFWCDTEVTAEQVFSRADLPLELEPRGGGGTDFRPVFKSIEDSNLDPACLIYLSDMECGYFPDKEPHYPVLWARTGTGGRVPPFGEMIDVCR